MIYNLFKHHSELYAEWKNFIKVNIFPFPLQFYFLLDESILSSLVTKNDLSPVEIFVYIDQKHEVKASFMLSIQREDLSCEITFITIDQKIRKTIHSGKIILQIADFCMEFFQSNNLEYVSCLLPVENKNLIKVFKKYDWTVQTILRKNQMVVDYQGQKFRRDNYYLDKILI